MAQSYGGTDLGTNWHKDSVETTCVVNVDWDKAGGFADIASRVLSVHLSSSLLDNLYGLPLLGRVPPATARLVLDNYDNYFSPDNASSAIHTDIQNGIYQVPVQIDLGYATETLRQFTGYIMEAKESEGASKQVTFTCVDALSAIQQYKYSSDLLEDYRIDQIISAYMEYAGVSHSEDKAFSRIPYAGLDDETILSECQKVASADGGWIRATKEGIIVFERMTHWLEGTDHTSSNVTLDTGEAWWMGDSIRWDEAYTEVTVPWTPRVKSPLEVIYQSMEPIEVKPSDTETVTVKFDYLIGVGQYIEPVASTDFKAVSAGMVDMSDDLTIEITQKCRQASVAFTNANADQTIYVLDFQLRGYPLLGRETHEISKTHDADFLSGSKVFRASKNFYMQTEAQAERRASFLRDLLQRPRRLLGWKGPAVPWLELGDRVHVDHKTATYSPGIDVDGYIVGLNQSYRDMYEMTLTILPVTDLWAEATYFKLGTSSYADSGADALFY